MKCKVVFWKNWDATFGAKIEVIEAGKDENDFPVMSVFRNNKVDFLNSEEAEHSSDVEALIDFVGREKVIEWVRETRADLEELFFKWKNTRVPEDYEFVVTGEVDYS